MISRWWFLIGVVLISCMAWRRPVGMTQNMHLRRFATQSSSFTFADVKFPKSIGECLKRLGITRPSPIQEAAILPLSLGLSALVHAGRSIWSVTDIGLIKCLSRDR